LGTYAQEPPTPALAHAQRWLRTLSNRELQSWTIDVRSLLTGTPVESLLDGVLQNDARGKDTSSLAQEEPIPTSSRSPRYTVSEAGERIRKVRRPDGPDARPFAEPFY
jgi:hypothetical protein